MNDTMKAILERRSTRHYTAEPVSEEDLAQILEAGLWAPTARNRQEVKIAVAKDPAWRARFRAAFAEKDGRPNFSNFDFGCPVFLFLYGEKDFPYIEMDSGIEYNPLEKPDPDITLPPEERPLGGLGIFMTKKMADDISYKRENGCNILTLTFKV